MRSAFQLFSSMMNHPGKGVLTVVELQVSYCHVCMPVVRLQCNSTWSCR